MKNYNWLFTILTLCVLLNNYAIAIPTSQSHNANYQQAITEILQKYPGLYQGILVTSLNNNKIVYANNSEARFTPASNTKLFTAVAALDFLGADYIFKTQFLTNARVSKNHILPGNLYVKFDGAPDFTDKDLESMVIALRQAGVHRITGTVFFDNSSFDNIGYGPGWMWDDENNCYSAPVKSIIINQNCFAAKLKLEKKIGHKPQLINLDKHHLTIINNQAKIIAADNPLCSLDLFANSQNHYQLKGCIAKNENDLKLDIAIKNPTLYGQELFKQLLQKHHISYQGQIKLGKPTAKTLVLVNHNSKPIRELVKTMLKDSNNMFADAIFKKIGQQYFHQQGNWLNSALAMRKILEKNAHLDFTNMKILDGAGGSRYNLITPIEVSKLLAYVYHNPKLKQEFIDALPISGIDGTLKDRLQNPNEKGKIKAKTGSMQGVSNLSGFINTNSQQQLSFVILFNNFPGKVETYQDLQDQICGELIKY